MVYHPSRRLIIPTAVFAVLVGAIIVILPEVVRWLAVRQLESILTVPVQIDDVDVNLFTGDAAIEGLVVGTSKPRPILSLPSLAIEFSRLGLLTGRINLGRIAFQKPQLVVERLGPRSYNILESVRFPQKPQEIETGSAAFVIGHLAIHDGEIVFVDHTQEPDHEVTFSSLDVTAGPISSLRGPEVTPTRFTAGLKIAGGTIKFGGTTRPFGEALETQVTAEIADVRLKSFEVYLPYGGRLDLEQSLLNGQARYMLVSRQGKMTKHYLDATLKLGNIDLLAAPAAQPILQLGGITARDIHLDLLQKEAKVGALIIDKPYLLVSRDSAGFNLKQFMPASQPPAEDGNQNEPGGGAMRVVIQHSEAQHARIEFVDETVSPAVKSTFESVAFAANNVVVSSNFAAGEITAEGQLGKGSINLTGHIDSEPLEGQLSLTGKRLPFEQFRGYLNQLFSSAKSSGDYIDGQLKIVFAPENQGETVTSISGNLEGHDMALQFPDMDAPFLTTDRLGVDLRTIRLGSNPRADIDRIAFRGASLRVLRNKNGNLNLSQLWRSDEQKQSRPAHERGDKPGTTVAIRSISVDKSKIEIIDRSVSPNYTTTVAGVHGNVMDLLPSAKRAQLELDGILGDEAKLRLTGWFTPYTEKPYMHLQATIRSYALPPLNPYATEYISHRIRQGQITTEIDYTLKGDALQATADIVVKDLRVGERTGDEFAQRIGIPLELAVALLQDINGVIRLQLAMNSDRSPTLNIANLVWTAVGNAIVRAITAPFRLIGNILTIGGRIGELRIEPVSFKPGTRALQPQGKKQLEELATLLKEKPQLELKLNGGATQGELGALKKESFWERIESAAGKDYQEALVRVYRDMGGITQPPTPLTPEAEASLERFVTERIEVTGEELRKLARERAEIVERELQNRGIDPQRLSASAAENLPTGEIPAVYINIVS